MSLHVSLSPSVCLFPHHCPHPSLSLLIGPCPTDPTKLPKLLIIESREAEDAHFFKDVLPSFKKQTGQKEERQRMGHQLWEDHHTREKFPLLLTGEFQAIPEDWPHSVWSILLISYNRFPFRCSLSLEQSSVYREGKANDSPESVSWIGFICQDLVE